MCRKYGFEYEALGERIMDILGAALLVLLFVAILWVNKNGE